MTWLENVPELITMSTFPPMLDSKEPTTEEASVFVKVPKVLFRGEFQINVSGHLGGVHGAEDSASSLGGIRETQIGAAVERATVLIGSGSVGSVPVRSTPFLGDGQPDVAV